MHSEVWWLNQFARATLARKRSSSSKKRKLSRKPCNGEAKSGTITIITVQDQIDRWMKSQSGRERKLTDPEAYKVKPNAEVMEKYGFKFYEWEMLFFQQKECCAICYSKKPGSKLGWHIDHCHKTGKVRGILCHRCNTRLGVFERYLNNYT